ncbi:MAG: hypothetical protein Q8927_08615 [Bacteroidota bacterium]|nr:hypothetical protein [Bacteroidota bacterium]MDP4245496.1 hypothetical protein [Bacteroidota bacterium]MDP4253699.1 hypothetical protein [Bacteroidota bacterium]MDP4259983.1 hypothetical protein [Bacteroidota bacterium]
MEYKVISTKECLEYLKHNQLGVVTFNPHYSIQSMKGIIYTLPNGKFVLVPSNYDESYPGIIFKDEEKFIKYRDLDSFPIGEAQKTWLVAHVQDIRELTNPAPSQNKDIEVIRADYFRLLKFIKDKRRPGKEMESAMYEFGISAFRYAMQDKSYTIQLEKRYSMYNPYLHPLLVKEGRKIDLLTILQIALENGGKNSFDMFAHHAFD